MNRFDLLTPEGTRDLLYDECAAKRTIEEKLRRIFTSFGYSEVITPGLEFFDVFNGKSRHFAQEGMYKLVDGKNRLMVLRPDNTMPIARLAATRLKKESLPLKLYYNQSIFRVHPKNNARDDEFTQSGVEILGGESIKADYEALMLAAKALSVCGDDFRLEIGESGIFRLLAEALGADEDTKEIIHNFVETKNFPALKNALSKFKGKAAEALEILPSLFGGEEVFNNAENYMFTPQLKEKLDSLKKIFNSLNKAELTGKIRVDLGLVQKRNYYTGILFSGYVEGLGLPVLSGGRYDTLMGDFGRNAEAVGFAVNVEAAAKVLLKNSDKPILKAPDILVHGLENAEHEAINECVKLISEGFSVYNSLFKSREEAENYARLNGIKRMIMVESNGNITVKEL